MQKLNLVIDIYVLISDSIFNCFFIILSELCAENLELLIV